MESTGMDALNLLPIFTNPKSWTEKYKYRWHSQRQWNRIIDTREPQNLQDIQTSEEEHQDMKDAGLPTRRSGFTAGRCQPWMESKQHRATKRQSCVREEEQIREQKGWDVSTSCNISTRVTLAS